MPKTSDDPGAPTPYWPEKALELVERMLSEGSSHLSDEWEDMAEMDRQNFLEDLEGRLADLFEVEKV